MNGEWKEIIGKQNGIKTIMSLLFRKTMISHSRKTIFLSFSSLYNNLQLFAYSILNRRENKKALN